MEHYVTIFDSLFLPQGLALHASMQRHAQPYTLWIVCVDQQAYEMLCRLSLPNVRPMPVTDVETDELRRVKPTRTRGEYCWTLTPFAPAFVFAADIAVSRVTYLDADLWFRGAPATVLAEFERSGKFVLVTEHAYAPEYDQSRKSGRFCVQFMTFVRGVGEPVRQWWADRCIEWCYARFEDAKFGDQMYLEDWPERFPQHVHVLQHQAAMQAPWNATRFPATEASVFHFHGLRLVRGGAVLLSDYYHVPEQTLRVIYDPYLTDLKGALAELEAAGHTVRPQIDKAVMKVRARIAASRVIRPWHMAPPAGIRLL